MMQLVASCANQVPIAGGVQNHGTRRIPTNVKTTYTISGPPRCVSRRKSDAAVYAATARILLPCSHRPALPHKKLIDRRSPRASNGRQRPAKRTGSLAIMTACGRHWPSAMTSALTTIGRLLARDEACKVTAMMRAGSHGRSGGRMDVADAAVDPVLKREDGNDSVPGWQAVPHERREHGVRHGITKPCCMARRHTVLSLTNRRTGMRRQPNSGFPWRPPLNWKSGLATGHREVEIGFRRDLARYLDARMRVTYCRTGMTYSAPLRIPDGQRSVTVLRRV